jgi:hypothetical protein
MELIEGIKTRRSIRKFTEEPVSKELIQEIIETSRFSPSWKNSQTPKYIAITDPKLKDKIAMEGTLDFAKNRYNIKGAPVLIILAYTTGLCGCGPDGIICHQNVKVGRCLMPGLLPRPSALQHTKRDWEV